MSHTVSKTPLTSRNSGCIRKPISPYTDRGASECNFAKLDPFYLPNNDGTRTLIPMAKASVQCQVVGKADVLPLVSEAGVGRVSCPKWHRALTMKARHA